MHYFLKTTFLLAMPLAISAQNMLPVKWKFKTGNDSLWAKSDFDDSQWAEIETSQHWEKAGYENYDGYAWYRVKVNIPAKLKSEALKYGGLSLNLGKIDDANATYFNGQLLGKTGDFPPNFINRYDDIRQYKIPADKVLWGKENTIAVCVYDHGGNGGMYSGDPELKVMGAADNIKFTVAFDSKDQIFRKGNNADFSFAIKSSLDDKIGGKISVTVKSDFGDSIGTLFKEFKLEKQGQAILDFEFDKLKPGFYNAAAQLISENGNKKLKFSFGVEPEKIQSPTDFQPDFDSFWEAAKKELATVKPDYKIQLIDSLSKGNKNVYVVEMRSLGNVRVKGWYSVPKKEGKFPAILHVQGYSSFLRLEGRASDEDFIAFGLNIRGHGFSKDDVNPGFPGYLQYGIEDKNKYVYRGAYMDCRRALDFLFSRPEVDTTKVAVEGGSQGGALSMATAALNPERIKLCLPHVPFLSDFPDYFKIAYWPGNEFKEYMTKNPGAKWDDVYRTLSYFDIKNLAPKVKCPTLMAIGLIDEVCPPHINFAAYNQLNVPKEYIVYPTSGHGLPAEYHTYKYKWIKKQWGMK